MDMESSLWFTAGENMEDYSLMNSFVDEFYTVNMAITTTEDLHGSISCGSYTSQGHPQPTPSASSIETASTDRPATKLQETNTSWTSCVTKDHNQSSSPTNIVSFQSPPQSDNPQNSFINMNQSSKPETDQVKLSDHTQLHQPLVFGDVFNAPNIYPCWTNKRPYSSIMSRAPSLPQEHLAAERKRREKLTQRFVALSAVVPGLKKMDKASVLGEAVKYIKEIQEQLKTLEEQAKQKTMESVVFVKKSHVPIDDASSSSDENLNDGVIAVSGSISLPEIEARSSDDNKNLLIRIHCEKHRGFLGKIVNAIEKLNLSVLNTSVMPFGSSIIDITIIAQIEPEFSMSMKNLVRDLRLALLGSI